VTRRYTEPVDVRRRDDAPAQFLWRGRVYVVRDVLAHWVESRPWWLLAEPAGRASASQPSAGQPSAGRASVGLADEREVWRVEAGAGRLHGVGVYDLRFDWFDGRWTLDRVLD
jgi:hypothetical protein